MTWTARAGSSRLDARAPDGRFAKIVVTDIETGGLDPDRHPITQVAAVAVELPNFEEVATFERKLRFRMDKATPEALEMNSWNAETWAAEAIDPPDAVSQFGAFLSDHATRQQVSKRGNPYRVAEIAGHNAATFDMPFLRRYFKILDMFMPAYPIPFCSLQLARWWQLKTGTDVENLKLGTLAKHFGVEVAGEAHDALVDVRTTTAIIRELLWDLDGKGPG